jgi:hypothetical protein
MKEQIKLHSNIYLSHHLPLHQLLRVDQQQHIDHGDEDLKLCQDITNESQISSGKAEIPKGAWSTSRRIELKSLDRVIPRGSAGQHHHQNHQICQKNQVKRKRFLKNSYGSKNVKQEQTRNKVQTKVQNVCTRAAEKNQTWRNKIQNTSLQLTENTWGSSKTIETD